MKLDTVIVESLHVIKITTMPKLFDVAPRNHHSLSYRIKGENMLYSGNAYVTSHANTLTFVPAGLPYNHHIITPSEQIVANFTTRDPVWDIFTNIALPLNSEIERLFQLELEQKNSPSCMSLFYHILALTAKRISTADPSSNIFLDASVSYMRAHYRESDFNIAALYRQAHTSPAYYRRLFHAVYQCSPVAYLKNLRINYAKQLLSDGYYTVAEIAEMSGFSSQAYFSYEFKRMTGCTPSQYRG